MTTTLRKSQIEDLEVFFSNQKDPDAIHLAAFTSKNPNDREAYINKWSRLLKEESVHMQTILLEGVAIGCIVKFVIQGEAEITYALKKEFWGQGIVSRSLQEFLKIENTRPIFGRTAFDNFGSQKVLETNGFNKIGTNVAYANGRGKEIQEFIYRLDA